MTVRWTAVLIAVVHHTFCKNCWITLASAIHPPPLWPTPSPSRFGVRMSCRSLSKTERSKAERLARGCRENESQSRRAICSVWGIKFETDRSEIQDACHGGGGGRSMGAAAQCNIVLWKNTAHIDLAIKQDVLQAIRCTGKLFMHTSYQRCESHGKKIKWMECVVMCMFVASCGTDAIL